MCTAPVYSFKLGTSARCDSSMMTRRAKWLPNSHGRTHVFAIADSITQEAPCRRPC